MLVVVIIVIIKHIMCTYGIPTFISYLAFSGSSQFAIIRYVWFQMHMIIFKQIGIKHQLALCSRTQIHKTLRSSCCSPGIAIPRKKEMHRKTGHRDAFGTESVCAQRPEYTPCRARKDSI